MPVPGRPRTRPVATGLYLKRLTDVVLLEREKRGIFAYYRLAPEAIGRVLFA